METTLLEWKPVEGIPKKRRHCNVNTPFSRNRANHRNEILKTWAIRLENIIEPQIPEDYISPFSTNQCIYCGSTKIGPSGDEFRPITQRGRMNKINCVPCCGRCNSSKQDKCGNKLIEWIKINQPNEKQQQKIIKWYREYEKFMLIPLDIIDDKNKKTYKDMENELDEKLNKIYEYFS